MAAVIIGVVIAIVENEQVADVPKLAGGPIGALTAVAFLVGAACSMASGIIGMTISVRSNVRTAAAARRSLVEAVQVAMRGGAVSGFLVVGPIIATGLYALSRKLEQGEPSSLQPTGDKHGYKTDSKQTS